MHAWLLVLASLATPQDKVALAPFPKGSEGLQTIRGKVRTSQPLPQRQIRPHGHNARRFPKRIADSQRLANVVDLTLPNAFVYVRGLEKRWHFEVPKMPYPVSITKHGLRPRVLALFAGRRIRLRNDLDHGFGWGFQDRAIWGRTPKAGEEFTFRIRGDGVLTSESHPWMWMDVFVAPHPFFAVTDDSGRFALPPLPPGDYEVVVRHALLGTRTIAVTLGKKRSRPVTFVFAPIPREGTEKELAKVHEDFAEHHKAALTYKQRRRTWPGHPRAYQMFWSRRNFPVRVTRNDPWGSPYTYRISAGKLILESLGPDRFPGTADDITSDRGSAK